MVARRHSRCGCLQMTGAKGGNGREGSCSCVDLDARPGLMQQAAKRGVPLRGMSRPHFGPVTSLPP
jgi:hypothetical protein